MTLRFALLDAAHDDDHNRRNFRRELDADIVEYAATEGDLPETFAFDAAVVTGSRASAYWEEPWIAETKAWIESAIDDGLPMLGVCFGHQLLADVLGGSVEPMEEYEIGYREIDHDGESPLFAGIDDSFTAFTTHSDHVAELPPGAETIAENDYGVHGFRQGDVFAVQFHPEYDPESARDVTRGKDGILSEERIDSVLEGISPENYQAACEAKQLFDNFTEYVREQGGANDGDATRQRSAADD